MIDPTLTAQIKRDEGCARQLPNGDCEAYPDILSGGDPWTIWWGQTGNNIRQGTVWTREQAESDLENRLASNQAALLTKIPWTASLTPPRQRVLANMQYNLGLSGLLDFPHMLAACQAGQYSQASAQMLNSLWARQVGARADRLAKQMDTGIDQ